MKQLILFLITFSSITSFLFKSKFFHLNNLHKDFQFKCTQSVIESNLELEKESTPNNNYPVQQVTKSYTPSSYKATTSSNTRVYQPKSSIKVGNSTNSASFNARGVGGGTSTSSSYRSDQAATDKGRRNGNANLILEVPQLLIRFRIPREITDYKRELQALQSSFAAQTDDYKSKSGDDRGRSHTRDSFFDNFAPAATTDNNEFSRKVGSSRGKTGTVFGKDNDRKQSEGGRPKTQSEKRGSNSDDDEIYNDDEFEGDVSDGSPDYYGDDENVSLSTISAGTLLAYEQEGLSLEDIQMTLYGEYGIKASVSLIKRRLQDDKFEKKGKKKTGKTRKDRTKARNARFNQPVETEIELPDSGSIQIRELAESLELGAGEIIKYLMLNEGVMVTMTQNIDNSIAKKVILAFGKKYVDTEDEVMDEKSKDEDLFDNQHVAAVTRSPVVTIMGHVDHGKTSLLDSIRNARVALGEAGGITQGISAFKVTTESKNNITFIDTPGHAAFSEMRVRGANITDIVVLVVAADDGVMEQTKECIAAAKSAGCPIVVAINKVDKEGADPSNVKTQLMSYDVLVEEFGGDAQCVLVSAKKGTGIEELLEKVLIQAEVMNLRTAVDASGEGTVIEARVDKGLGVVVTTLVQKGSMSVGDIVIAGPSWGRIRRLITDQGVLVNSVGPSTPVQIIGMNGVPNAGDTISVVYDEAAARETAESRKRISKQASGVLSSASIIANAASLATGDLDNREVIKIPLLIKADVLGSIEALRGSIEKLEISDDTAICKADIVYSNVGDVTSSDVSIAAAAKAKIVAFNVASGYNAMEDARASNVDIKYCNVIYELLEELKTQIEVTLAPPPPGTLLGRIQIKKVFKIGKAGKVAGCEVTEGIIKTDSKVRILRGKRNVIYTGTISSLKVVKSDVNEVPVGSECGVSLKDYSDFEEGDILECFSVGNSEKSE